MIREIHYFSTELKTKIDVIPRGCFNMFEVLYICCFFAGDLVQWLKLPAWKVGDRRFVSHFGIQVSKKQHVSSLLTRTRLNIVGSLSDREVACSASDRRGSNFESCVWGAVSPHSSHHPQEVLMSQFSLYVHKCGLNPINFILFHSLRNNF